MRRGGCIRTLPDMIGQAEGTASRHLQLAALPKRSQCEQEPKLFAISSSGVAHHQMAIVIHVLVLACLACAMGQLPFAEGIQGAGNCGSSSMHE